MKINFIRRNKMTTITAAQIANELDISRSYLYYLKNNGAFELEYNGNSPIWDYKIVDKVRDYLTIKKDATKAIPTYKTIRINNRRYLGNKYKLTSFIRRVIDDNCKNISTVADIFSGTGSVASAFLDKRLITNDIMYSNYICHIAWFGNNTFSKDKIINYISYYNNLAITEENYMTKNFADTYFNFENCSKIGFIREDIERLYNMNKINSKERALLITSLLYSMDKIANTCGHYDAYRKNTKHTKPLELYVPMLSQIDNKNLCYNKDANKLVKEINPDLVYIDPPYNSRQYCDIYHLLENIAKWDKPNVYGVARKMNRTPIKSNYCTNKATDTFKELIKNINSKYIVLSYNNMAEKGNERSNAKISDKDIMEILSNKGEVNIFSANHKAFTAGKSNIEENQERLFVCKCYDN